MHLRAAVFHAPEWVADLPEWVQDLLGTTTSAASSRGSKRKAASATTRRNIFRAKTAFDDISAIPPPGGVLAAFLAGQKPPGKALLHGDEWGASGDGKTEDQYGNVGADGSGGSGSSSSDGSADGPAGDVWLVLSKKPPSDAALVDTDIFNKKWVHKDSSGVCRGNAAELDYGESFDSDWNEHPSFLFSRRVHRVKVTLKDLNTSVIVWDADYYGDETSPGSDYELGASAKPAKGLKPYFRYFCPPHLSNTRFELCLEDIDNAGFRECYQLEVGGVQKPGEMPLLKPLMETTHEWDGAMPVKGLGLVASPKAFANVGGVAAGQLPPEVALGITSAPTGMGGPGGHGGGNMLPGRFGRPRYPLVLGATENPNAAPAVPRQSIEFALAWRQNALSRVYAKRLHAKMVDAQK
eukprot:CAMPEP_0178998258 /NCGR_PEP_ID=MMETSP0795-20121207/9421_1 /TAXON_ID=88552 /ORGANISM="Amoebophrya sp., Strain Ameob2" /LENGTH=408 /DNA_ID=CAMNT_0020690933 /DNA_START=162 /DNA_END=1389 /DNA_ORIENTATION=-